MQGFVHLPVLVREVVDLLAPVPPGTVVDATVGGGGHAAALLRARDDLRVLGIDRDAEAVAAATRVLAPFGPRARVVHGGFEHIGEIGATASEGAIVGVLFDLGVSSPQLDRPERGFTYWGEAPLDMRMDARQELTAADVVNGYEPDRLARVIREYGEEPEARRIAAAIVARRPLRTAGDLVDAVRAALPHRRLRRRGHPARRTFQAVRMEVNRELEHLEQGLDESVHLLTPGGRVLVIAYHSLEDRLVKHRFEELAGTAPVHPLPPVAPPPAPFRVVTRRPVRPAADELAGNPRSESARLRALERVRRP